MKGLGVSSVRSTSDVLRVRWMTSTVWRSILHDGGYSVEHAVQSSGMVSDAHCRKRKPYVAFIEFRSASFFTGQRRHRLAHRGARRCPLTFPMKEKEERMPRNQHCCVIPIKMRNPRGSAWIRTPSTHPRYFCTAVLGQSADARSAQNSPFNQLNSRTSTVP